MFIHDALVEAILAGETAVAAPQLHRYVDELLVPGHAGRTRLDEQFEVSSSPAETFDSSSEDVCLLARS